MGEGGTQAMAASLFDRLPDELVENIISFLPIRAIPRVAAVSRRFRSLALSDSVWGRLCVRDIPPLRKKMRLPDGTFRPLEQYPLATEPHEPREYGISPRGFATTYRIYHDAYRFVTKETIRTPLIQFMRTLVLIFILLVPIDAAALLTVLAEGLGTAIENNSAYMLELRWNCFFHVRMRFCHVLDICCCDLAWLEGPECRSTQGPCCTPGCAICSQLLPNGLVGHASSCCRWLYQPGHWSPSPLHDQLCPTCHTSVFCPFTYAPIWAADAQQSRVEFMRLFSGGLHGPFVFLWSHLSRYLRWR